MLCLSPILVVPQPVCVEAATRRKQCPAIKKGRLPLLIRQALFVNLARAEVSKPLDGLKLNGIGTLQ